VAEWLQQNFFPVIEGTWATSPERDIGQAFVQADETLLQAKVGRDSPTALDDGTFVSDADINGFCLKGGFFGAFGERGVGGSKCGATCALAMVIKVTKTC
jgi:protein phosphatase 1L